MSIGTIVHISFQIELHVTTSLLNFDKIALIVYFLLNEKTFMHSRYFNENETHTW